MAEEEGEVGLSAGALAALQEHLGGGELDLQAAWERRREEDAREEEEEDVIEVVLARDETTSEAEEEEEEEKEEEDRQDVYRVRVAGDDGEIPGTLFASELWEGAKELAQYLLCNLAQEVRGKRTLELGAGAALPSLVAARHGAKECIITDYPHENLVQVMRDNVQRNRRDEEAKVLVMGHKWGDPWTDPDDSAQDGDDQRVGEQGAEAGQWAPNVDLVLATECLWLHDEHSNLLRSIDTALKPGGKALLTFCHHVPGCEEKDLNFFALARAEPYQYLTEHLLTFSVPHMYSKHKNVDLFLYEIKKPNQRTAAQICSEFRRASAPCATTGALQGRDHRDGALQEDSIWPLMDEIIPVIDDAHMRANAGIGQTAAAQADPLSAGVLDVMEYVATEANPRELYIMVMDKLATAQALGTIDVLLAQLVAAQERLQRHNPLFHSEAVPLLLGKLNNLIARTDGADLHLSELCLQVGCTFALTLSSVAAVLSDVQAPLTATEATLAPPGAAFRMYFDSRRTLADAPQAALSTDATHTRLSNDYDAATDQDPRPTLIPKLCFVQREVQRPGLPPTAKDRESAIDVAGRLLEMVVFDLELSPAQRAAWLSLGAAVLWAVGLSLGDIAQEQQENAFDESGPNAYADVAGAEQPAISRRYAAFIVAGILCPTPSFPSPSSIPCVHSPAFLAPLCFQAIKTLLASTHVPAVHAGLRALVWSTQFMRQASVVLGENLELAQQIVSAIAQCADSDLRHAAFDALGHYLDMIPVEPRLRVMAAVVQQCPFHNMTGLLIDRVRVYVAASRPGSSADAVPHEALLPFFAPHVANLVDPATDVREIAEKADVYIASLCLARFLSKHAMYQDAVTARLRDLTQPLRHCATRLQHIKPASSAAEGKGGGGGGAALPLALISENIACLLDIGYDDQPPEPMPETTTTADDAAVAKSSS